jgi:hypothetical protein
MLFEGVYSGIQISDEDVVVFVSSSFFLQSTTLLSLIKLKFFMFLDELQQLNLLFDSFRFILSTLLYHLR